MNRKRWVFLILGSLGILLVYIFQFHLDIYSILFKFQVPQRIEYTSDFDSIGNTTAFIVNKVFRYLLNDGFAIMVIYALFEEKKYVRFSVWLLLFGLFVILPIYLAIFLLRPEGFSSLLGHMHRIILNPVLMMMLIPAFYYQKTYSGNEESQ